MSALPIIAKQLTNKLKKKSLKTWMMEKKNGLKSTKEEQITMRKEKTIIEVAEEEEEEVEVEEAATETIIGTIEIIRVEKEKMAKGEKEKKEMEKEDLILEVTAREKTIIEVAEAEVEEVEVEEVTRGEMVNWKEGRKMIGQKLNKI